MGPCLCGDPCCSYCGDPSLARYAERLAKAGRYEEEYRKSVEETDDALRNWGKM